MSKATAAKTKRLCEAWIEAKRAETAAKERRIEIEAELSTRPEIEIKYEGSKKNTLDEFTIETKGSISYSLDADMWEEIKGNIPESFWPVQSKLSLVTAKTKSLREKSAKLWAIASNAITTKPGKPGFKITKEAV